MTAPSDRVLLPYEAARLLSVSTATLSRWAHDRRIPHMRTLGGRFRYMESEILRLRDRLSHPVTDNGAVRP